ncbi:MAG: acyltransferase 3 [Betaproteobacteria bacterium]|nr:acyltransferase 3 [Betaproteobacteria bacterium]
MPLASSRDDAAGHLIYRPDIDGLRALAVIAVVAFHAFPGVVTGGFVGVDIFFVISGFLISSVIFAGLADGSFSYAGFYARRVRRIFPALLAVLLATFIGGLFILSSDEYRQLSKHVAAGAAFVSNFALWNEAGYFDALAESKPLLHLWSLAIEEQFYIVWPLLLGWPWRRRWNLPALLGVIGLLSLALCVQLTGSDRVAAFYSPLTRFWELAAGGMLAYAQLHAPADAPPRGRNLLSIAGLAIIVLSIASFDAATAFPGWAALLPVTGSVMVIAAGPAAWCNRRLLAAAPLVWLGLISYPLYLWHWPLLVFANHMDHGQALPEIRVLAVAIATVLAWHTYRVIETPVRRGGARPRAFILPLALMMGLLCAAAAATHFSMNRVFDQANLDFVGTRRSPACASLSIDSDFCMLEAGETAPTVALVGDSFANALYFGLRDYYKERRQVLFHVGNGGCPPLLGIESSRVGEDGSNCARLGNLYLRKIAEDERIKTVILAANWHLYLNGRQFEPAPREPEWRLTLRDQPRSASNPEVFAVAFERTVQYLAAAHKRIIVVQQTPELGYGSGDCAPAIAPGAICKSARAIQEGYLDEYKRLFDPLLKKYPAIAVVDPLDIFCDREFCYSTRDGVALYHDPRHLSKEGSQYLGRRITMPN